MFFRDQFHRLAGGLCLVVAGAAGQEPALQPVVLQLPYTHQFQFAGVYAAVDQGFFREEGLDVEVRSTTPERTSAIVEVLAGRAHVGIAQGPQLITSRLEGGDVVVIAAIMQHSPQVLLTRAEDNLNTPQDLIGKRVALDDTSLQSEIRQMLEREGVGHDRITVVPNHWQDNELLDGTADAMNGFLIDVPYTMRRAGVPVRIIRPLDYGVDFYGDCLFTSEAQIRRDPALVERVRRAVLRGWEYALDQPDGVIRLIVEKYPVGQKGPRLPWINEDTMRFEAVHMAHLINNDLVQLGHINAGRWQRMAEIIHRYDRRGDLARMAGMLHAPPPTLGERLQGAVPWLLGVLGLAVLVAVGGVLTSRRLQSLVARRTEELRQSEQRQREFFDLAPAPIIIEDYTAIEPVLSGLRADGITDLRAHLRAHPSLVRELLQRKRVVAANRLALANPDFPTLEAMNRREGGTLTEQALEMFAEQLVAVWEGRDGLTLEKTYHRSDGSPIHVLVTWQVNRRDGRPDLANVRLVFTDLTAQKLAEQALRASEARYRELFERAAGGIYRSSPEGRFLTVNPALARMFGFAHPEEMIAWTEGNAAVSLYAKPGRREEFQAAFGLRGQITDFESEVNARDGRTIWISENAREIRDEQGRLLHYEGFVTDITARRQLEAEQGRASKLEAVGLLAGGIAHDFNNILTIVLGNITLLEADTAPDSALHARLAEVRRATFRARDLTLQLLTFAKGGEPVKAAVDLAALLKESAAFSLHGAKVRAEYRVAPDLWPVQADRGQLGQVVQNLVINAVQAMPDGGVITITADNVTLTEPPAGAGALAPGRFVAVTVADTGVGIAPEHMLKIFDPYFTTKAQGTGLGLATAYSIIRKHGGHIAAESMPGQGTLVRLWLPAVDPAAAAAGSGGTEAGTTRRARVLFMDDEEPIRGMATIFMDRLGYDCSVASDGAEVLRLYREAMASGRKYDAVVMDLTVPGGMGGREAMEQLLRIDPEVRAIVSSGYSRDPVMASYRTHGFLAVLPKPYGLDQLRLKLGVVLDGAGAA
jgi:PAS domain S-box-containing protein